MKKRANKVPEEDESLCCCEYVNRHGERSHIAACCCDCEDLDDVCDRINSCVGQANHRSFLLLLVLFLSTSLYGIILVLQSVCPTQPLLTSLLYCPGVYNHYSAALCFTCAWYSSIVTAGLLHLLVTQVINVSHNVTEREARAALRDRTARSACWGLVVHTGVYSRGFRGNWAEFMAMGVKPSPTSLNRTALVALVGAEKLEERENE